MWTSGKVFGNDLMPLEGEFSKVRVKIRCMPLTMKAWVLVHSDRCEVIELKAFREEIQMAVLEAYRNHWQKWFL